MTWHSDQIPQQMLRHFLLYAMILAWIMLAFGLLYEQPPVMYRAPQIKMAR